jgi:uncharacterized protein (UPF0335 family)
MEKNNNDSMTIEDLALMVKRGFDQTATKEDLKDLATKVELNEVTLNDVKGTVQNIVEELNAMHVDVRYIRSTTDALVHSDVAQEAAIEDLTSRVDRLEQKVGLAR